MQNSWILRKNVYGVSAKFLKNVYGFLRQVKGPVYVTLNIFLTEITETFLKKLNAVNVARSLFWKT